MNTYDFIFLRSRKFSVLYYVYIEKHPFW